MNESQSEQLVRINPNGAMLFDETMYFDEDCEYGHPYCSDEGGGACSDHVHRLLNPDSNGNSGGDANQSAIDHRERNQ